MKFKALAMLSASLYLVACQSGVPPDNRGAGSNDADERSEAAVAPHQEPPPLPLRAIGQEPGWILELSRDELDLSYQYGEKQFKAPAPEPEPTEQGYRYNTSNSQGQQATLQLQFEHCSDVMSGMPYPYTATVYIDQQTLQGCAGDPQSLLTGIGSTEKEWFVKKLDGEGVIEGSLVSISFTRNGEIRGTAGCNRFFGSYEMTGAGIAVGELAHTEMACAAPLMEQEGKVLQLLGELSRFELQDRDALVLHSEAGERLTAYPSKASRQRE